MGQRARSSCAFGGNQSPSRFISTPGDSISTGRPQSGQCQVSVRCLDGRDGAQSHRNKRHPGLTSSFYQDGEPAHVARLRDRVVQRSPHGDAGL